MLLAGLRFLVGEWPERFTALCEAAQLTRKPLVVNMPCIPDWYDVVAEMFSQANGRRPYKRLPLVEHLDLDGIALRRSQAVKPREQRRWEVLWHYHRQPEALPVARELGVPWDFVIRTVKRYNQHGPDWMDETIRARVLGRGRLLSKVNAGLHRRRTHQTQRQRVAGLVRGANRASAQQLNHLDVPQGD